MTDKDKGKPQGGLGETVGSVAEPYIERLIIKIVRFLADARPIKAMLRDLSPDSAEMIYHGLPGAIGWLITKVPIDAFKSPAAAVYVRSLVNEAGKAIGDVVKDKGGKATDVEKEQAVEAAVKRVDEKKLVFAVGSLHLPTCIHLSGLKPFQKQDIAFKDALDQGLQPAPCCFPGIASELKKQAAPPSKKAKPNPSAFDIIGAMDPAQQKQFSDWINQLSEADEKRVVDAMHELDSVEEFIGFMAMDPKVRIVCLPLLENRNFRFALHKAGEIIKTLAAGGYHRAAAAIKVGWQKYRDFDKSLEPRVQAELVKFKVPRPKPGWWRMFRLF